MPDAGVDAKTSNDSRSLDAATVLRRLGPAGVLAVIASVLPAIGGFALLGLLNVVGPWLRSHEEAGVALYICGFAVLSGLAVLPTYAQSILGGWAFGFRVGFLAALCGFIGGALIGYFIGRFASGDRVVKLIEEKPKWRAVYDALLGGGFWKTLAIVTLLRLPPNSPFAITNLVLAATRVSLVPYLLGTAVGLAPRTAAAVMIAASVKDFTGAPSQPRWLTIAGIAAAVVVLVIIGVIAQRAVQNVTRRTSST